MMKPSFRSLISVIVILVVLLLAASVNAQSSDGLSSVEAANNLQALGAPTALLFSYQGQLLDTAGNSVNNSAMPMTFKLYTTSTGGTSFWTENHTNANAVNVQNGLFNVLLGQITAINTSCVSGDAYLELVVNGETLSPRERLSSVAYAVGALDSDKLDSLDSSYFASASHLHDDRYFTESESDSRFVNTTGDTINGYLTAEGKIWAKGELWADGNFSTYGSGQFGQPGVGEGGEVVLQAGSSGNYWTMDNYFGQLRFHHDDVPYVTVESDGTLTSVGKIWAKGELWANGNFSTYGLGQFGQSGVGEGGKIILRAGSSGNPWTMDNYFGQLRFHHDGINYITVQSGGDTTIGGSLFLGGTDLIFKEYGGRGGGRAMVNDNGDILTINYANDFSGGVRINGPLQSGALVESNLQTPAEQDAGKIDRFAQGDVLCWGIDRLEMCTIANDRLVQAVADSQGRPIVLGAEAVKVIGPMKRGDILVASSVPGYAMVNNNPQPGTVIAQALEDFNGERGVIKAMIRKW